MSFFEEPKSHILFIPGVFIEDCIDDIEYTNDIDYSKIKSDRIEQYENEHDNSESENELYSLSDKDELEQTEIITNMIYDTMPEYFINKNTWIKEINLLCAYCHDDIKSIPYPAPLIKTKILLTEEEKPVVFLKNMDEDISSKITKEYLAYKIHFIAFCCVVCSGNYIRKISDNRIVNKKESIKMLLEIYKEITGEEILDIPDKNLWIVMNQYCGNNGEKRSEYREKNNNKEIKLKYSMSIS